MLKNLVRVAGVAIAGLLALVAGLYLAAADLDALPESDFVASVSLDDSPTPRAEIIQRLDEYADATSLSIARVAIDPDDFLHHRLVFVFGSDVAPTTIEWFSADMTGTALTSDELGSTPLAGVYGVDGSASDVEQWALWMRDEFGASVHLSPKTAPTLMTYALLNVGAWVPMSSALVLIGATVLAWYVLGARGRELRVLAGMRVSAVAANDIRTLTVTLALPAIATAAAAVAIVAATGFGRVGAFVAVLAILVAAMLAVSALVGACVGLLTLPDVRSMADRTPPEKASWFMAEILKAGALIVAAALIPFTSGMAARAAEAAELGQAWPAFGEAVTVRIGDGLIDGSGVDLFAALVRTSDERGDVFFSMSLTGSLLSLVDDRADGALADLGYDGIIIANDTYLDAVTPLLSDATLVPSTAIASLDELPDVVSTGLLPTLSIWTVSGGPPEVDVLEYEGEAPMPVFGGRAGYLESEAHPLVLRVSDIGGEFNDDFLASAVSLGTIAIADEPFVHESIDRLDLSDFVLSVDLAAELGLAEVQTQVRTAQLGGVSLIIAMLAVGMAAIVTAWIFALIRRRRWFVERTAGLSWLAILRRRLVWEAALGVVAAGVTAVALLLLAPHLVLLAPLSAAGYLVVSLLSHLGAARVIFRSTLARRG